MSYQNNKVGFVFIKHATMLSKGKSYSSDWHLNYVLKRSLFNICISVFKSKCIDLVFEPSKLPRTILLMRQDPLPYCDVLYFKIDVLQRSAIGLNVSCTGMQVASSFLPICKVYKNMLNVCLDKNKFQNSKH